MLERLQEKLRFVSFPMLVAVAMASLPACQIRYRHEVEKPGTPANFTYSAGGFMRYDGYDDVAGDMEIAVRDYEKPGSGTRLRLAGVIHIGDIEYYEALQRESLDTSDVVLFEGVKFEGDEEALKASAPDLAGVYGAMGTLLGIGFQKDGIDYTAKNFVHCDVTVKEGDPLFQTVDPEMINQASKYLQPLVSMKGMLGAMGDPKRTEDALKHGMVTVMAAQMEGEDERAAAERAAEKLGGPGDEQLKARAEKAFDALKKAGLPGMPEGMKREVLDRRNDYVVKQLAARLKADGEQRRQMVAIFYGAAHMPGIEKELAAWGYRPVETAWYKAWRMNGKGKGVLAERISHGADGKKAAAPSSRPRKSREPVLY